MKDALDDRALEQLFRGARTYPTWTDRPVDDGQIEALYELLKWGPTSMNCLPARFVFLRSPEAKERLRPALMAGNVDKVMEAPVTVIVAHDLDFHERLPELFPHMAGARDLFAGDARLAEETAFRNGTLQGAYLILAARALGLDVGPMSGFDNAAVDREFFADSRVRANFLANIGYGDDAGLYPRGPRPPFAEVAELL